MSVLMLPEPEGWRSGRRRLVWAVVGTIVICGWLLYCGVVATMHGHYLTTAIVVGWLAPVCAAFAALALTSSGPKAMRAKADSTGTTVWLDKRLTLLLCAGFATFIPAGVLFVIYVPQGAIDLPMSPGLQVFLPVLMAFAVVMAVVGVIAAWRRGGLGYLKLSPAGIEVANIVSIKSIGWEDVDEVQDHSETKKTRKAVALCLRDGSEEVVEGLDLYVDGSAALYWMVRHYWRHPDDRAELTDGRALGRLHNKNFDLA